MSKRINELIDAVEELVANKVDKSFFGKLRNYKNERLPDLDMIIDKLTQLMGELGTKNGELDKTGVLIDDLIWEVNSHRIEVKEGRTGK